MTSQRLLELLLVGAGGFLGAVARFLLSGLVHRGTVSDFPWGTLAVNTLGCLGIGVLAATVDFRGAPGLPARLFLGIGVLGGFTTFSTFAHETLALAQGADLGRAAANVCLQLALGLAAAWLGYTTARLL